MRYYLGLDNGVAMTKAAIFDKEEQQLGVASMPTASLTPKAGYVERDMEEMWQANCAVIRDVMAKTGVQAEEIAGVGICGHGKGLYLWGKDGRPACNGIISSDNWAYEYPVCWALDGTEARAFEMSCRRWRCWSG